ncbi:alpha/beta hydrolase family protein [Gemmatimonas sp.]|uniref:alpha/beta hydrolase family protein n=1 Tax=Gemmatimonas sp. TaxID=1962908 RepID=UPI0039833C6D
MPIPPAEFLRAILALLLIASRVAAPAVASAQGNAKGNAQGNAAPRLMRAGDVDTVPLHDVGIRIAYGGDSLQFGELRLPADATNDNRAPIAIVIHGGCWYSPYASVRNSAPLADALAQSGVATWNVEYRRYDNPGGGWTGTFRDVADGADYVRTLAKLYPIDTTRIVLTGHSAGGHLALWLASRYTLERTSPLFGGTPLRVHGVVSVGGIADLREFFGRQRTTCGNPAVESLLGGTPDSVPARLRESSPIERLPLGVPTVHLAGDRDFIAPVAVREAYVAAARASGDSARVVTIVGDGHFEAMTPYKAAGRAVIDAIRAMLDLPAAIR